MARFSFYSTPGDREHFLFKRFGRAIAKPGKLVIDTNHPLGDPATSPRVDEEGPGPLKGTAKDVTPRTRLIHVTDPVKHPEVIPGQGKADVLFVREHGQSSRN